MAMFRILVITIAIVAAIGSRRSGAHEWYPKECCASLDCAPYPSSNFRPVQNGWRILQTGEVIPFDEIMRSPDEKFHRCIAEFWEPNSLTKCLFVPDSGS